MRDVLFQALPVRHVAGHAAVTTEAAVPVEYRHPGHADTALGSVGQHAREPIVLEWPSMLQIHVMAAGGGGRLILAWKQLDAATAEHPLPRHAHDRFETRRQVYEAQVGVELP